MIDANKYLASVSLLSDQIDKAELRVILRELHRVLANNVAGDVVEFGCYVGTTSVHLQRFIKDEPTRKLWLYDSFAGLPEKGLADHSPAGEQFIKGELFASKAQLVKNLKSTGLPLPYIKKAWFSELSTADVPAKVAFAFLDGDYYDSILDPLKLIWPRLSEGGIVIVDDYMNESLPGAKKAVDEWAHKYQVEVRTEASLAIIKK